MVIRKFTAHMIHRIQRACVRFVLTLLSASEEKVCGKRSLLRISEFCGATVSPITLHTAKTLDTPIFLLISRQKVGSLIKISGRVIIHTSLGVGRQNVSDWGCVHANANAVAEKGHVHHFECLKLLYYCVCTIYSYTLNSIRESYAFSAPLPLEDTIKRTRFGMDHDRCKFVCARRPTNI